MRRRPHEAHQHRVWEHDFGCRLIAIVSPDSAPIKRMVQEARERSVLIDASYGRRTRSVLVMDNDHLVLSALQPETLAGRIEDEKEPEEGEET